MVYKTTPNGSKKHAAAVCMPVREVTTAEPPVKSIAVTKMFVKRPKQMYTQWVMRPYRARMTSRKVCAFGALLFNSMAIVANRMI
jgi:hypothetical protein